MKKILLLFLLAVVVFISGCTETPSGQNQTVGQLVEHKDPNGEFSIKYPSGWDKDVYGTDDVGGYRVWFTKPITTISGSISSIYVRTAPPENIKTEAEAITSLLKQTDNAVSLSQGEILIDDKNAYQTTLTFAHPDSGKYIFKYVFVDGKNGRVYRLEYKIKEADYNQLSQTIDDSIKSFRVLLKLNTSSTVTNAPVPQNDAGAGKDAPDSQNTFVALNVSQNYTAQLDRLNGDSKDVYKISLKANESVKVVSKSSDKEASFSIGVKKKVGTRNPIQADSKQEGDDLVAYINNGEIPQEAFIEISAFSTNRFDYSIEVTAV